MADEILLDVCDLEPPEPLVLTLEAAARLKPGQYVRMLHRREPCLLYGNLDNSHFRYYRREGTVSAVEVFIWAEDDETAAAAVQRVIQEK